jgi:hypothetical protein
VHGAGQHGRSRIVRDERMALTVFVVRVRADHGVKTG